MCSCVHKTQLMLLLLQFSCPFLIQSLYSVSSKKRPKCFFVISPINLVRFWWNLVYRFLNKVAAKWCKRFPPYLNNASTLPCETWNDHWTRATIELLQENSRIYPTSTVAPNSPDSSPFDYSVRRLLQEKVYKTCISDLDELKQQLRTEWAKSSSITAEAIRQWRSW